MGPTTPRTATQEQWEDIVNIVKGKQDARPLYSTTGQNTDGAMTQKATTDMVFADGDANKIRIGGLRYINNATQFILIGGNSNATNYNNTTVIGFNSYSFGESSTVIGRYSNASSRGALVIGSVSDAPIGNTSFDGGVVIGSRSSAVNGSVAIGHGVKADTEKTVSFGDATVGATSFNRIVNIRHGIDQNDAATIVQGNKIVNTAPGSSTVGALGQLITYVGIAAQTGIIETYQCTAIDNTDPNNPVYTWTKRW